MIELVKKSRFTLRGNLEKKIHALVVYACDPIILEAKAKGF